MATLYNASHTVRMDGLYSQSSAPEDTTGASIAREFSVPYATGSGSYLCNKRYAARLTSSGTNIDLDNGASIQDVFGNFLTFTTVRGILVVNRSAVTGETCTVTGDFLTTVMESGGAGGFIIKPGGRWYIEAPVDGYTVAAGTGDNLVFTFVNTTLGIDVFIWGS